MAGYAAINKRQRTVELKKQAPANCRNSRLVAFFTCEEGSYLKRPPLNADHDESSYGQFGKLSPLQKTLPAPSYLKVDKYG